MMKLIATFSLLAIGLLYVIGVSDEEAMAKCQLKHSYDTCFSSLNP